MNRQLSRINIHITAVLKCKNIQASGKISNLSLNGTFVEISEKHGFSIGDNLDILIQLTTINTSHSIDIKGIVKRMEQTGIAIQFTDIDLDSFVSLKNLVIYNDGDSDKIDREFAEFANKKFTESKQKPD